jgi:hypothetical protein
VSGGNAAEPVGIPGIVAAAATGHERKSVLQQGAKQALSYQPLQFGDGGTSPLYLDLDATAIEFPRQYNEATAEVTYNSVDNVAGLTYYPGTGQTVKHTNAVISSSSRYHWRLHASASASATYDFRGLTLIGAGDVQLRAVTTFTGMAFVNCPTITQNSALISGCTFSGGSKVTSATLGDMDNISGCTFTSPGTGYAIEVSGTASTVTFTNNTFTGYAATDGSTGNEAIFVNIASGSVTINVSGGNTPSIRTAGATVTVSNPKILTLTNLQTGSDIVILTNGTTTVRTSVDQNVGSTYAYNYSDPGAVVDVCVYKAGFYPWQQRGITLSATNADLNVAQVEDVSYVP